MKIIFTIHAKEKLKTKEAKDLGIKRQILLKVLKNPLIVDKNVTPHKNIGKFTDKLSLVPPRCLEERRWYN